MTTLTLMNRGLATATSTLPNNRRSVSDMDENQRKAVMAKLGGGGGAAGGYTGGARGGRRGPERNPTPMYVTPEGHARAVREAQIGIQSDITPFDLLASTALEAGLDGINQARMNTDNKWVDAALGVAALGLFAAGVKNARTQQALAKHVSAQKTVDNMLEQMGRDAARFDSMLKGTPSSVGEDVYRTYDQLAERVTRARGYPPSAAEANRWLDKVAPKVTPSARGPNVVEDVKAFRADTLRTTGVAATDNDVATYLLKKHPESYTPPKNYIPPKSSAGNAFRSEAAKTTGSQQAQFLDYAHRADMEAVKPRIVKDPWRSTKEVLSQLSNKELHMNTPLAPALRLIKNAKREARGFIANAGPMTDEQRRAMFARAGGPGGRSMSPAPSRSSASYSRTVTQYNTPFTSRTPGSGIDQGVGLAGSERPSHTINLNRFDSLLASFEQEFPGGQSTVATRMESILSPFRKNPEAIFDNPQAINQLFALIAPAVAGNTGAKNYDTKRGAMESSFYSEGLKILQAAGLMPGWSATSTSGPGGYSGVRFQNDRPTQTRYTTSRSEGDTTFTRSVTSGGGGSKTPPVYYRPPNDKGVGYYNPNQPYVPGQPRINERGQPVWGPKPGEPGFIDIGKWREGANPKGPISKPTPVKKK